MSWLIDKLLGIDRVALGQGEWSVIWRNPPLAWVLILLIIPAIIFGTYYFYRKEGENVSSPVRLFLTSLRCILIFLLLVILFEPVLSVERTLEQESTLAVLIDDSLSMSFTKRINIVAVSQQYVNDGYYYRPQPGFIYDKSYPFVREVYFISRETFAGLGSGFINWACAEQGQRIVLKSGLVPATMPIRLVQIKH